MTGALGFIGRALCQRFRAAGAEVHGVDLTAAPELGVVAGDVSEAGDWQQHAEGCDLFVHTAAIISMRDDFAPVWRANVMGTRRALDAARAGGAGRFLHLSSIVAFSFDFPDGVTEAPSDSHQRRSLRGHEGHQRAGGAPSPRRRRAGLHRRAPRRRLRPRLAAVDVVAGAGAGAGRLLLLRHGPGVLSPVYVDNLVDGIVLAATREEAAGQVFTLTDGVGVTTAEFFGHYARLLGKRLRVVPTPVARALASAGARLPGETEVNPAAVAYVSRKGTYSIEKARTMLGYEPAVDLAEGMRRTLAWLAAEGYGAGAPLSTKR